MVTMVAMVTIEEFLVMWMYIRARAKIPCEPMKYASCNAYVSTDSLLTVSRAIKLVGVFVSKTARCFDLICMILY